MKLLQKGKYKWKNKISDSEKDKKINRSTEIF